jgi:5-hydroxyisourate hydrolase-like protein (transthyretin family)
MLCHQALKCFNSNLFNIDKFDRVSDDAGVMGTAQEFINATEEHTDSSLIKNKAVKIIKDLTLFHIHDNSLAELADIDLKRLNYLRNKTSNISRDTLYIKALYRMLDFYNDSTSVPRILSALADFYFQRSSNWRESSVDYKWNKKRTLELCEIAIKNYPGSYGAEESKKIKRRILDKSLNLQAENANLPGEPFQVSVKCQNIDKIYFRIIEAASTKSDSVFKDEYDSFEYYCTLKPYLQFSKILPDSGDYSLHTYEVTFPSLPIGKYIVLASSDSSFSSSKGFALYQNIYITNLSAIIRIEKGKSEIYVLDRKNGKPLEGVNIKIWQNKKTAGQQLQSNNNLVTDKDGYASINHLTDTYNVTLSSGKDSFEMDYFFGSPYRKETEDEKSYKLVFFMDRKIYRPGQTIFFKGLYVQRDNKTGEYEIAKNEDVSVYLYNANRSCIKEFILKTNEYGSFSGQYELPENLQNGIWELSNKSGRDFFYVEEYKRPQFEVQIDKIKGEYSLNDEIKVTGRVLAYSGVLLSGDIVKYRVERSSYYLYGNWKYLPEYNPYESAQISEGSIKTGEKGDFTFTFKAIPDPRAEAKNPVFSYRIYVEVIDATGESHKTKASVMAGYVSMLADINIPEVVSKDQNENYSIVTKDLNGNFKATSVRLALTKLKNPERIFRKTKMDKPDTKLISKDEFYKIFKYDAYGNENNYINWEKEKQVYDSTFITSENISFESKAFNHLEQGKYRLVLSAKEKSGKPIEIIKYFTLLDPKSEKIPLNDALWFHLSKRSAEPGEKLKVSLGTALENMNILFEIENKGKSLKREWFKLSNEQKLLEIPIKEKYRGKIILHCYAVWENSVFSFSEAVIVPWSNKNLKLELETFRNKITPGETEQWKIKVKDHKGNPAEAEVIAAMYDESLDALRQENLWNFNIYNEEYWGSWWNEASSFSTCSFFNANCLREGNYDQPQIKYTDFYYYGLFPAPYGTPTDKKYKSRVLEESLLGYPISKSSITVPGIKPQVQKDVVSPSLSKEDAKEEAFTFARKGRENTIALCAGGPAFRPGSPPGPLSRSAHR